MTNRQARALANAKRQADGLSRKELVQFEEHLFSLDDAGVLREFGRKVPEVSDLYGSVARRERQAKWDAEETATPVISGFTPGKEVVLALRPVEERVAARAAETIPFAGNAARKRRCRAHLRPCRVQFTSPANRAASVRQ